MKKAYVETSVASYLAVMPSRDLINAARQKISWEWWKTRRHEFAVFVSQVVLREAGKGSPEAAARRMQLLQGIQVLSVTPEAEEIAAALLRERLLPPTAVDDALHLSLAVVH